MSTKSIRQYKSGIVIRGNYITDNLVSFGGREEGVEFFSPDPHKYVEQFPLGDPTRLADLYELSLDEILDYLVELGGRLEFDRNPYLQEAFEAACLTSADTPPLIKTAYRSVSQVFSRKIIVEALEHNIGIDCLEGWRKIKLLDGREIAIRAFGARGLHIIAGNSPVIAAMTIMRNAVLRSDAIIKNPSNDPFTALAIARTMIDMAPDHPVTKHLTVAYWKGGDESIERQLYQPRHIEKIVAWGGLASVKHVTKFVQPGLELVTLDPKQSVSIIGPEAFQDDATRHDVACRLATDIGAFNQNGCVSARVIYVLSGTDRKGIAALNEFGQDVYNALMALPSAISTKAKVMDSDLRQRLNTARLNDEWYNVIGGKNDEGAVIVSQIPERVEFAPQLTCRVANLVPVDSLKEVLRVVDGLTQTVGVYPDSLKSALRDKLPLYGAQRLTSLGYACVTTMSGPWDAIEPMRRLCKWIIDETCDPAQIAPLWESGLIIQGSVAAA